MLQDDAMNATYKIVVQNMFLSEVNKNYLFFYQINCSKDEKTFCWSFYVKVKKGIVLYLWKYHKFSDDILDQIKGK